MWEYGTMSATMKAGFFLLILAGFFLPSAEQGSSSTNSITTSPGVPTKAPTPTVPTKAPTPTVPTKAPTPTVPTKAPTATDSNSTNSINTSPGGSNSTNSITTSRDDSNSTNSINTSPGGSNSTNTNASPGDSGSTSSTNSTSVNPEVSTAPQPTSTNIPVKSCETQPCGTNAATCTAIYEGYICHCPYGYYYAETDRFCLLGKQFFGSITVGVPYSSQFMNSTSREYKSLYDNVTTFFKLCFENETSYAETLITKISEGGVKSRSLKAATGPTDIEAINIFTASSAITQDSVNTMINNTIHNNLGSIISAYKKSSPCNSSYCDEVTTTCNSKQNDTLAVCDCKAGYFKRQSDSRSCPDCDVSCTQQNKKECIQKKTDMGLVPECQCLISHKPGKSKAAPCIECDYGYSGEHCEDSFQLILIIIGTIAGALVLALLGGVIALSLRSKKTDKSPDKERLIKPEDNAVFGSSQPTDVPQFPRVVVKPSTNTNNASSANPYEMDEQFKRAVPTRDYDDDNDSWFEMAPKNTAFGNNSKF